LHEVYQEVANWGTAALSPLAQRIKAQKKLIEQRLAVLRKVNETKESVETEIQKLEQALMPVLAQQRELEEIAALIEGTQARASLTWPEVAETV